MSKPPLPTPLDSENKPTAAPATGGHGEDECARHLDSAVRIMEAIAASHAEILDLLRAHTTGSGATLAPSNRVPAQGSPREISVNKIERLSRQELRVLQFTAGGLSNRQIARTMELSEQTVKNYLYTVFKKLGVNSRTEAVIYLIQHGHSGLRP